MAGHITLAGSVSVRSRAALDVAALRSAIPRLATATMPLRKNGRPWKCLAARARDETRTPGGTSGKRSGSD